MGDDWDLVVIGAGAAGLAAAVAAGERGARVLVLESEEQIGGSMILSGGVFTAAGTSVQAELGIEDSPESYFREYMSLNRWLLQPGLVRSFCHQSTDTFEWLLGLGLDVPAKLSANGHEPGVRRVDVEAGRRGHVPVGEGLALTEVLDQARRRHGSDVVCNTRIERLIVEDGRVAGVVADGIEVRVPAVVVATGGMTRNPELLARYFPQAVRADENVFVVSGPGSRGDHIGLGQQVDAAIVGDRWGMMLLGGYFQRLHHWQSGFPPVARILVDTTGRRYVNEDAPYSVGFQAIESRGGHAWMIFDERARLGLDPTYASWTPHNIEREADAGRTHRAPDLETLASRIDVPAAALTATVQRWNDTLPNGHDPDFLRHESLEQFRAPLPEPIAMAPFYAVRVLPSQLIISQTGLQIDSKARVIDRFGRIVPGLFAAGEAAGGLLGPHYIGGCALASALTMGRRAGLSAPVLARSV